jgi:maleylpyruvate isomerase
MKLYSANLSPFATRVRMAVYAKGLDVKIEPAGALRGTDALKAINPLGKIPALALDDGGCVPESQTIVEYLEEAFPEPALRPADAEGRARVRLLERVGEVYVLFPISRLFGQMNPESRDQTLIKRELKFVDEGLAHVSKFLGDGPYAAGADFTTADCLLTPTLFYAQVMSRVHGDPEMISRHPKIEAYMRSSRGHPVVAKALQEMSDAVKVFSDTGDIT